MHVFTDNAESTLASSILSTDTSLPFATGTGALFPDVTPSGHVATLTLEKADGSAREIVKLTGRSTDTGTIVRAQEGTTALAFSTGDKISLRETSATIRRLARNPFVDRQAAFLFPNTAASNPGPADITPSATGTLSTYTSSFNGTIADEHRAQLFTSSGTTTSSGCGFVSGGENFFFRSGTAQHGGFFGKVRFVIPTLVAGNRLFIGFSQSGTLATLNGATEPSATGTDMFGIGMDSGDTNITIYSKDGTTQTKTALSTPVSGVNMSGRMYDLELECDPGVITTMRVKLVEWNGDTRTVLHDGTISANLPRANQALRFHWGFGQGTDSASARTMRFCRAYFEHSSSPSF